MKSPLTLLAVDEVQRRLRRHIPVGPPLYVTQEALDTIWATVGQRPPETGAMAFGRMDRGGIDHVEFDARGSGAASSAVYAPDTVWANARQQYWLGAPDSDMRLLDGFVHSHPSGVGAPSHAKGDGIGDLGYAKALLRDNESMEQVFLPILTGTGTRSVELWSWVVERHGDVDCAFAPVTIAAVAEFPARCFNPDWESQQMVAPTPSPSPAPEKVDVVVLVDFGEVAERLGAILSYAPGTIRLKRNDVSVELSFRAPLPMSAPSVHFVRADGSRQPFVFRWRGPYRRRMELRLTKLAAAALRAAREEY